MSSSIVDTFKGETNRLVESFLVVSYSSGRLSPVNSPPLPGKDWKQLTRVAARNKGKLIVPSPRHAKQIPPQLKDAPVVSYSPSRPSVKDLSGVRFKCQVVDGYPQTRRGVAAPDDVAQFCFPDGLRVLPEFDYNYIHYFVMLDADKQPMYGTCLTFFEKVEPEIIQGALDDVYDGWCDRVSDWGLRRCARWNSRQHSKYDGRDDEKSECWCGEPNKQLSDQSSEQKDGSKEPNKTQLTAWAPRCICLLSRHPFNEPFLKVLKLVYSISQSHSKSSFPMEYILDTLFHRTPLPPRGLCRVELHIDGNDGQEIVFRRPPLNRPLEVEHTELIRPLFRALCMNHIIRVFELLLMQQNVLLVSRQKRHVTLVANALESLFFPMSPAAYYTRSVLPCFSERYRTTLSCIGCNIVGVCLKHFRLSDEPGQSQSRQNTREPRPPNTSPPSRPPSKTPHRCQMPLDVAFERDYDDPDESEYDDYLYFGPDTVGSRRSSCTSRQKDTDNAREGDLKNKVRVPGLPIDDWEPLFIDHDNEIASYYYVINLDDDTITPPADPEREAKLRLPNYERRTLHEALIGISQRYYIKRNPQLMKAWAATNTLVDQFLELDRFDVNPEYLAWLQADCAMELGHISNDIDALTPEELEAQVKQDEVTVRSAFLDAFATMLKDYRQFVVPVCPIHGDTHGNGSQSRASTTLSSSNESKSSVPPPMPPRPSASAARSYTADSPPPPKCSCEETKKTSKGKSSKHDEGKSMFGNTRFRTAAFLKQWKKLSKVKRLKKDLEFMEALLGSQAFIEFSRACAEYCPSYRGQDTPAVTSPGMKKPGNLLERSVSKVLSIFSKRRESSQSQGRDDSASQHPLRAVSDVTESLSHHRIPPALNHVMSEPSLSTLSRTQGSVKLAPKGTSLRGHAQFSLSLPSILYFDEWINAMHAKRKRKSKKHKYPTPFINDIRYSERYKFSVLVPTGYADLFRPQGSESKQMMHFPKIDIRLFPSLFPAVYQENASHAELRRLADNRLISEGSCDELLLTAGDSLSLAASASSAPGNIVTPPPSRDLCGYFYRKESIFHLLNTGYSEVQSWPVVHLSSRFPVKNVQPPAVILPGSASVKKSPDRSGMFSPAPLSLKNFRCIYDSFGYHLGTIDMIEADLIDRPRKPSQNSNTRAPQAQSRAEALVGCALDFHDCVVIDMWFDLYLRHMWLRKAARDGVRIGEPKQYIDNGTETKESTGGTDFRCLCHGIREASPDMSDEESASSDSGKDGWVMPDNAEIAAVGMPKSWFADKKDLDQVAASFLKAFGCAEPTATNREAKVGATKSKGADSGEAKNSAGGQDGDDVLDQTEEELCLWGRERTCNSDFVPVPMCLVGIFVTMRLHRTYGFVPSYTTLASLSHLLDFSLESVCNSSDQLDLNALLTGWLRCVLQQHHFSSKTLPKAAEKLLAFVSKFDGPSLFEFQTPFRDSDSSVSLSPGSVCGDPTDAVPALTDALSSNILRAPPSESVRGLSFSRLFPDVTVVTKMRCPFCKSRVTAKQLRVGWGNGIGAQTPSSKPSSTTDGPETKKKTAPRSPQVTAEHRAGVLVNTYATSCPSCSKKFSATVRLVVRRRTARRVHTVAFLPPLVLYKELCHKLHERAKNACARKSRSAVTVTAMCRSLLMLTDAQFINEHPTIYWNMVLHLSALRLPFWHLLFVPSMDLVTVSSDAPSPPPRPPRPFIRKNSLLALKLNRNRPLRVNVLDIQQADNDLDDEGDTAEGQEVNVGFSYEMFSPQMPSVIFADGRMSFGNDQQTPVPEPDVGGNDENTSSLVRGMNLGVGNEGSGANADSVNNGEGKD